MSAVRHTGDRLALCTQGAEHLEGLRALLGGAAPPEMPAVRQALAATRALRGTASLIGLDAMQGFLGRLFQLLEEVESGQVPWSARLHAALQEAEEAERQFLTALEAGEVRPNVDALLDVELRLAAWRRQSAPQQSAWRSICLCKGQRQTL